MQGNFIRKSDVYGTSTQAMFGQNTPTSLQNANGEMTFRDSPQDAPVKSILFLLGILIAARVLFEFV